MKRVLVIAVLLGCVNAAPLGALVNYDAGRMQIKGVQLLQDALDPSTYYYVPTAPRLATNEDGSLSFVAIKYVDGAGTASGGLFHCLVEFTLPPDAVEELEKELQKKVPGAKLGGPVPLMAAEKKTEEQPGSFEVVSAVLADRAANGMTRSLVSSGVAPFTPGSKAAIAAILNPQGATLLWSSLEGPTSDVSIAVNGYYEAMVTGFNGRITADVSTVYHHYSSIYSNQHDYTKRQLRDITDELIRNGALKVEEFDRGTTGGIKTDDMAGVLNLVTQKLTELLFDHKTGFSADPDREKAVEEGQLAGRQERSWLARTFGGTDDTKYYTDDQWVIKDRKDIRQNTFSITLTKNAVIRVPFSSSGNLHGIYNALKNDERYFRIVNLADPAFQLRPIQVQVDGNYVDAFNDTINHVAINIRKHYANPSNADVNPSITFYASALKNGDLLRTVTYPLLGESGADAMTYEYQVSWSVRDRNPVLRQPANGEWISSADPIIALVPPFEKTQIDIDADRQAFKERNVKTAIVEFRYPLAGKRATRTATLRATDADATNRVTLYRDRDGKTQYAITWYYRDGTRTRVDWADLSDTYFNLMPPTPATTPAGGTQ